MAPTMKKKNLPEIFEEETENEEICPKEFLDGCFSTREQIL